MAPRPKTVSSQPPPSPALEDLFTTLNRHIQASAFNNSIKLTDQILAIATDDEDALRCKVVALIKDDRVDDALSAIQSYRRPLNDFHFLKAYCLYRQNKLDDALEF